MVIDISRDEAERGLIGSVLLEPNPREQTWVLGRIAQVLEPRDFGTSANRRIYEEMRLMSTRNEMIDPVTLSQVLDDKGDLQHIGGPAYLMRLIDNVPRRSAVHQYIVIVKECARRDRLGTILDFPT